MLPGAAVYLTGVIEYLVAEMCEISADVACTDRKIRIQSNHILKAMRSDEEFDELTQNVIIPDGGIYVKVRFVKMILSFFITF